MSISFLTSVLLIVSLATNLTVEGLKKVLDSKHVSYSSNLMAAIIAVILAAAICVGYLVLNDIQFTVKIAIEVIVLMYLGFLIATVGYDKVIQMVKQLCKNGADSNV